MVVFYTLPPSGMPYPFIIINNNRPGVGLRYIRKHRDAVRGVIIDSGVEVFRDARVKDYPGGSAVHIARQALLYRKLRSLLPKAEIYATVPDYPDDYHHRSLWLSDEVTNIERTVENVMLAVERYRDVRWLIPVQGHYKSPKSTLRALALLREHGFDFVKYDYYGIANLCVEQDENLIFYTVRYVSTWFRERGLIPRLHIFGLKIRALRYVSSVIYSFDSTAWTKPVNSKVYMARNASCKNERERELFFCEYLRVLRNYSVDIPEHNMDLCKDASAEKLKYAYFEAYRI